MVEAQRNSVSVFMDAISICQGPHVRVPQCGSLLRFELAEVKGFARCPRIVLYFGRRTAIEVATADAPSPHGATDTKWAVSTPTKRGY
jgi:hypothetical protein